MPLALGWSSATAQDAALGGDGESPIEVLSDDGIEWRRDEQLYIARGNAVAIQGEDKVFADILLAHYRETEEGSTEIWRMEGHGSARIESPDRFVTGDLLVYEVDSGILVVTGEGLRMETPEDIVTAATAWNTGKSSAWRSRVAMPLPSASTATSSKPTS